MPRIVDLRNWAREEGIVGFSKMSKQELLEEWENSQPDEPMKFSWQPKKKRGVKKKIHWIGKMRKSKFPS